MFETIVVPTDGSKHAAKAVRLAADLASKYGSRLVLVHVRLDGKLPRELERFVEVEHLPTGSGTANVGRLEATPHGPIPVTTVDEAQVDRRAALTAIGEKILDEARQRATRAGVDAERVDTRMEEGDPAERILACAEVVGADAIVMGSRGVSDLKGLLMGSVSHKVSHLSRHTCITVHEAEEE